MAIRQHPKLHLLRADRISQIKIDASFEVVNVVAETRKLALERNACLTRQLLIVDGPRASEGPPPAETIPQMRGRQRISVGIVVLLDHDEILSHQKRRSGRSAWKE